MSDSSVRSVSPRNPNLSSGRGHHGGWAAVPSSAGSHRRSQWRMRLLRWRDGRAAGLSVMHVPLASCHPGKPATQAGKRAPVGADGWGAEGDAENCCQLLVSDKLTCPYRLYLHHRRTQTGFVQSSLLSHIQNKHIICISCYKAQVVANWLNTDMLWRAL